LCGSRICTGLKEILEKSLRFGSLFDLFDKLSGLKENNWNLKGQAFSKRKLWSFSGSMIAVGYEIWI